MFSHHTSFVQDYFHPDNIRYIQQRINNEFVETYGQKVFYPEEYLVPVMKGILEHRPDRIDQNGQRYNGLEALNEAVIHAVYSDIANEWDQQARNHAWDLRREDHPNYTGILKHPQIKTALRKLNPSFRMTY